MTRRPPDGLNDGPVLPVPAGAAMSRATELFQKILAAERRKRETPDPPPAPERERPRAGRSGERRYELALARIYGAPNPVEGLADDPMAAAAPLPARDDFAAPVDAAQSPPDLEATRVAPLPEEPTGELRPERPPPGAVGQVRPSAPAPAAIEAVSPEVLAETASQSLFYASPEGGTAFDLTIADEVFSQLACTVRLHEGRVTATFRAGDADTRRLLEAEAGRLRNNLEARGLRVDGIRVEVG